MSLELREDIWAKKTDIESIAYGYYIHFGLEEGTHVKGRKEREGMGKEEEENLESQCHGIQIVSQEEGSSQQC